MTESQEPNHDEVIDVRGDLGKLLQLAWDVSNAMVDHTPADERVAMAEKLLYKAFSHASTSLHLIQEQTLIHVEESDIPLKLLDIASAQVLARACLEVSLVFHHLYISPPTPEDIAFRFDSWMLTGFAQRERMPTFEESARTQKAQDKIHNDEVRARLELNPVFQALGDDERKAVLGGRSWPARTNLTRLAELIYGEFWGPKIYSFLSGYAHTSALSVIQMDQSRGDDSALPDGALLMVCLSMAQMVISYARIFEPARYVYRIHPNRETAELYHHFITSPPTPDADPPN